MAAFRRKERAPGESNIIPSLQKPFRSQFGRSTGAEGGGDSIPGRRVNHRGFPGNETGSEKAISQLTHREIPGNLRQLERP